MLIGRLYIGLIGLLACHVEVWKKQKENEFSKYLKRILINAWDLELKSS